MTIDFYYTMPSPPCRTVFLVAEEVGVKLNPILIDFKKKDHLSADFLEVGNNYFFKKSTFAYIYYSFY